MKGNDATRATAWVEGEKKRRATRLKTTQLARVRELKGRQMKGSEDLGQRERELQVDTAKQCINRYCLRHCDKMEVTNSKRAVAECVNRSCPLHPYRTGRLRKRGVLANYEKDRRATRLRTARRRVEQASKSIENANRKIKTIEDQRKRYIEQRKECERQLQEARQKLEELEKAFDDELEAGLWK